jgi:DNA-binding transcriptional MerR regulator
MPRRLDPTAPVRVKRAGVLIRMLNELGLCTAEIKKLLKKPGEDSTWSESTLTRIANGERTSCSKFLLAELEKCYAERLRKLEAAGLHLQALAFVDVYENVDLADSHSPARVYRDRTGRFYVLLGKTLTQNYANRPEELKHEPYGALIHEFGAVACGVAEIAEDRAALSSSIKITPPATQPRESQFFFVAALAGSESDDPMIHREADLRALIKRSDEGPPIAKITIIGDLALITGAPVWERSAQCFEVRCAMAPGQPLSVDELRNELGAIANRISDTMGWRTALPDIGEMMLVY